MLLGDRYEIPDFIGHGGMATDHHGIDTHTGKVVAIKVLPDMYVTDPNFVTRFQREAKIAVTLQHPNIVQVYDYGQTDGNYYMVMELIEGTDLRHYLRVRKVLDNERAIIIAHGVALGLGAAHDSGVVHGNMNTQNILMGRFGEIKVTGFCGMSLGGMYFYAPEQAQGNMPIPATDVYMLGIVMYDMVTGSFPFEGETPVHVAMKHIQETPVPPSQFNQNIPPALDAIILRCLEKVPEMRYWNGSQLARALQHL